MKKLIFIFLIGMLTIFVSQRAFAYGIGAYVTGGGGFNFGWGNQIIKSYPITNLGGGLVYDSNPIGKGSIYRLNLGIQQWKDTVSNSIRFTLNSDGFPLYYCHKNRTNIPHIHLLNDFGFDLYTSQKTKIWLGPQLGIGFGIRNADLRLFTASLGPVLGFNCLLNENVILSFDLSIKCLFIMKHYLYEDLFYNLLSGPISSSFHPIRKYNRDYDGGFTGILNISVIYRVGS